MNRADRRVAKREVEKSAKTINKLSPNQLKLIDKVSMGRAQMQAESILISYQRVVNASLVEHGFSIKQIEKVFNVANELMQEEDRKSIKLSEELKRSGNIEMAKRKIEEDILSKINTLMDTGKNRKEVIEAVLFKFPSMSKAMIINIYQEVKESRKKEENPDINEAMEKVADILEIGEDEKALFKEEKVVEESKNEVVGAEANLNPQVSDSKLKVLSMTLKGENGTYRACENGVEITNIGSIISFQNEAEIDEWANEVKQVFAMIKD